MKENIWNNIGLCHQALDQNKKAIYAFNQGLQINPTSQNLYLNRAQSYERMGDLEKAEENYRRLTERVGAHAQHQKLQGHIATLAQSAEKWKALSVVLDSLVKDFVDAGMLKLMVRVQRYLAESDVFGMKLTKSDCQIGFLRDNTLITALSGAEWARLLVAIACACAGSGTPVIIPEERMWDRETLGATMRALSKAPCQVILTSTEKPKGKLPAGWSVVEVDPQTLAVSRLGGADGTAAMQRASAAIRVGDEIWVGSNQDRIARFPLN
jgi:tetratricopeptide (TPR) repeat protein